MRFSGFRFACLYMICLVTVLSCLVVDVTAKPSLSLSFYKNDGYGMGNDMNGKWTINTAVSQNASYVEFYLDNNLEQNITSASFNWHFDTANYTEGRHTIKVIAYDFSGESTTVTIERNFVGFPINFILGIIAIIVAVTVLSLILLLLRVRKKEIKK